jgi:hypothetical protein
LEPDTGLSMTMKKFKLINLSCLLQSHPLFPSDKSLKQKEWREFPHTEGGKETEDLENLLMA